MQTSRQAVSFFFVISLLCALLIFIPTTAAQYAIPDCVVAQINGITNTSTEIDWQAARDVYYQQISGQWAAETAGLTPVQLDGYRQAYCASLVITDGGIQEDEEGQYWQLNWSYIPVSDWLPTQGSGSNNSGGTNTNTSNNPPTNTGGGSNAAPPPGNQPAPSGDVVFETSFDTLSNLLLLADDAGDPLDGKIASEDGDSYLHLTGVDLGSVFLADHDDLANYAADLRIRVNAGDFILTLRSDGGCLGYDFWASVLFESPDIAVTDADCETVTLTETNDASIPLGEWVDVRFVADGERLTAFLNGEQILADTDDSYQSGSVMLYMWAAEDGGNYSIDLSEFTITELGGSNNPETLAGYKGSASEIIAELQTLGLIPPQPLLIFNEPQAWFQGSGAHLTMLARQNPHTNIVMGGDLEVDFHGDSRSFELCTVMARVRMENNFAVEYVDVGITNEGFLFIADYFEDGAEPNADFALLEGDPTASHRLLVILHEDTLTVYIDGRLYFDNFPVEARNGVYGVGLVSESPSSRCEANNVWVYSLDPR